METKIDRETLVCAGETIQAAHDYIETHGFDMNTYEPCMGRCCFIGTVRLVSGLDPRPGHGNRKATTLALQLLDDIAKREGADLKYGRANGGTTGTGRFIESLGFQVGNDADHALGILRSALREIHKEVEDV